MLRPNSASKHLSTTALMVLTWATSISQKDQNVICTWEVANLDIVTAAIEITRFPYDLPPAFY